MGPGEEGLDDPGGGGGGHLPDGDRGHLVHSPDDPPEEEEQDGSPQQVGPDQGRHEENLALNGALINHT